MFISYCRLRRPTAKLGNGYHSLGDFKKAIEYHDACHLRIAKQVGGQGWRGCGLLKFKKAIEHHKRDLKIAEEVSNKAGEGRAYANLGVGCSSLGDFKKAIERHENHPIPEEMGDKAGEGNSLWESWLCLW